MKNSKAKGKILENYVAEQIRLKGLDKRAYREYGSGAGSSEKADIWTSMMILGQNVGIEVKNQKTIHIPEWWKQTRKLEKLRREPVLVFKIHNEPLGGTLATIYLDTLLEILKENKELKKQNEQL